MGSNEVKEVKVAVVGAGVHSQSHHIPALFEHCRISGGKVVLAAICDTDLSRAELAGSSFGFVPYFASIEEAIQEVHLDGIITVLPPAQTFALACQLLQHGIPLLVEKPPGSSLKEAGLLEKLRAEFGVSIMVSLNRRHTDCIKRLGQFARMYPGGHVEVSFLRKRRPEQAFLFDTGLHFLDTLAFLCGKFSGNEPRLLKHEVNGSSVFDFQFENGATARVVINPVAGNREESYTYTIGKFKAVARFGNSGFPDSSVFRSWCDDLLQEEWRVHETEPDYRSMGTFGETGEFLGVIRGEALPNPSLADVLPLLSILDSLCSSSKSPLLAV